MTSISIKNLSKHYGEQIAVDEISFSAKQGEILGFLGPNGAGKTTTMKMITSFLTPNAGSIEVMGLDVQAKPLEVRRMIGYLPEHNPLYLDMYIKEFLEFVGRIYGFDAKRRKARIAEVIVMTGLQREQHKQIGMLSKGYRQRVGLAQALFHDPKLLILDEPTTGLDPNQIVEIRQLIREVGKRKTLIFSSHILSEVEAVADRIVIINKGKLVADTSIEELQQTRMGEAITEVSFDEAGFDFSGLLETEGVKEVRELGQNSYQIVSGKALDIRRELFNACVAQGNIILSLNRKQSSLEEIFRELTEDKGA